MKYRKGSFEEKIDSLLPIGNPLAPEDDRFDLRFFELWRESEGGWSVNDSWRGQRDGDREETISLLRSRWEVFKANYLPKARVCDITDISYEGNVSNLEVDCTAFADVSLVMKEAMTQQKGK